LPAFAGAEVVRDFSFELKDPKAYGAYTVVFHETGSETTGAPVAPLTRYSLRFPSGISLRRQFLAKRFFCNVAKLRETRDLDTCKKARLGTGRALVQVFSQGNVLLFGEPIPAHLYFFFVKPAKGAVFSMVNFSIPDASAPVVRNNPVVRDTRPLLQINVYNDPTPDGLFGYRFELPVSIAGLPFSAMKVDSTFPGLTLTKRVRRCVRSSAAAGAARCRKKRTRIKRIFWATPPKCPASGKLAFQISYTYAALPASTVTHEIPCLRFPR
jgi:hypothetical protein